MFRLSALVVVAVAAIAGALQFDIPASGWAFVEGQPTEIAWSGGSGPVTITLKNGPKEDLKTVKVIGTGASGSGSITWTPDDIPSDTYALEITDGEETNYSNMFSYQGTGPAPIASNETTADTATPTITTPAPGSNDTMTMTNTTPDATAPTTTPEDAAATTEPATINDPENGNGGSAINSHLGSSMALVIGAAALLAFN